MLNWHEVPFVRLLMPFALGIIACLFLDYNSPLLQLATFLFFVASIVFAFIRGWYRFRWLFGFSASLFFLMGGYQAAWHYNELHQKDHFTKLQFPDKTKWIGKVDEAPVRKQEWVKVELAIKWAINESGEKVPCSGNVLCYISRDSLSDTIQYGDILAINGYVTPVAPPSNPNSFDYRRYLHYKNIHHQAFVRTGNWQVIGEGKGNSIYALAIDFQGKLLKSLRKHLHTQNELAVGSALILGYRDEIPENIQSAYSKTGAMHVLAVSGLHVGIVFLIVNFFLKRIRWRNKKWNLLKLALNLLTIWSFALITGAAPSVVRAATMFSFVCIGQAMRRKTNIYNSLAASAFLLLLYNPFWIASVSFQLSYMAVWGIVYFQPKFEKLIWIENKYLSKAWALICVSLGAQLMTLPLILFYFNQFPTFFWLSSLILVPAASFVLGAGIALFFSESFLPELATLIGKALWALLLGCNEVVFTIQNLPGAVLDGISPSGAISFLTYLIIFCFMIAISQRKMRWVLISLALVSSIGINYALREVKQFHNSQIVVYDVSKSTLIDFINGKEVHSFHKPGLESKTISFAAEGHRNKMGIKMAHSFSETDTIAFSGAGIRARNGIIHFRNTTIYLLDKKPGKHFERKIATDYLLLRESPRVTIEELIERFDFGMIIFDSSNKEWVVKQWKLSCEQLDIAYYDIKSNGALVINLKPNSSLN